MVEFMLARLLLPCTTKPWRSDDREKVTISFYTLSIICESFQQKGTLVHTWFPDKVNGQESVKGIESRQHHITARLE
jgi:hypothetical protein